MNLQRYILFAPDKQNDSTLYLNTEFPMHVNFWSIYPDTEIWRRSLYQKKKNILAKQDQTKQKK